ncbi:uncharacterized protein L201_001377 [Kwoniella dendrophila CBS 6074]|uniref:Uncharacterized protein n=1 Tax=Kwoniella dendrophila CBS 6074 TaxID=1295534 RepID=A0AAX4JM65_9TREE
MSEKSTTYPNTTHTIRNGDFVLTIDDDTQFNDDDKYIATDQSGHRYGINARYADNFVNLVKSYLSFSSNGKSKSGRSTPTKGNASGWSHVWNIKRRKESDLESQITKQDNFEEEEKTKKFHRKMMTLQNLQVASMLFSGIATLNLIRSDIKLMGEKNQLLEENDQLHIELQNIQNEFNNFIEHHNNMIQNGGCISEYDVNSNLAPTHEATTIQVTPSLNHDKEKDQEKQRLLFDYLDHIEPLD